MGAATEPLATHAGASAGKSMGNCFATGHAAGIAAALAWRAQGVLLFALSDKPDEASIPTAELAADWLGAGVNRVSWRNSSGQSGRAICR